MRPDSISKFRHLIESPFFCIAAQIPELPSIALIARARPPPLAHACSLAQMEIEQKPSSGGLIIAPQPPNKPALSSAPHNHAQAPGGTATPPGVPSPRPDYTCAESQISPSRNDAEVNRLKEEPKPE